MKINEVPEKAFTTAPTPIPMKMVPDWNALYQILMKQGFVIIESTDVRATSVGGEECVQVKSFNNHVRLTQGSRLQTKRISATRWYCTL
jgi:hypothetical protein